MTELVEKYVSESTALADLRRMLEVEQEEERIQAKLQIIGNCPMGFAWIKCQCGYRCAGGAHQVSDEQLKREFGQEVPAK